MAPILRPISAALLVVLAAAGGYAGGPGRTQRSGSGLFAVDAVSREVSAQNLADAPPPFAADAISREVAVFNDVEPGMVTDNALSREVAIYNNISPPIVIADAVSRELAVHNQLAFIMVTSTGAAHALPVGGTLSQQLNQLNAGPPAFDPKTWLPVSRWKDWHEHDSFTCAEMDAPLDRPFVSAATFIAGANEVTFDNCSSAFYRFTLVLPQRATRFALSGIANVDDQGVAFLNGVQISGTMTNPNCNPTQGPGDPCYAQQHAGKDEMDAQGRWILTWPTTDAFGSSIASHFFAGVNELVFAVCGDAAPFEPTGIEFSAAVDYVLPGDLDYNGVVDVSDLLLLLGAWGFCDEPGPCRADIDGNRVVDVSDLITLLANWG